MSVEDMKAMIEAETARFIDSVKGQFGEDPTPEQMVAALCAAYGATQLQIQMLRAQVTQLQARVSLPVNP